MKSLLKILAAVFLSMTLANCAMLGLSDDEGDKKTEDTSTMSDSDKESMDSEDSEESASTDAFDSDSEDDDENAADTDMAGDDQSYSADDSSPAVEPEPEPEPARAEASAPFKDGMYTFATDCTMREDPEGNAPSAGTVRGGKKLWVEGYDNGWVKVFKKSGPVFVSKGCL